MAKEPLTATGVQQKFNDLYALNDAQLNTEAGLIAANFRQWVKDNFILNTDQESYLDGLDDVFIASAASDTSIAARNRLGITYQPPTTPPGVSKYIRKNSSLVVVYDPVNGTVASGSVSFEAYYEGSS